MKIVLDVVIFDVMDYYCYVFSIGIDFSDFEFGKCKIF